MASDTTQEAVRPQRIQLSRRKGFNLQAVSLAMNGLPAVKCARPGRWGNPVKVGMSAWEAEQAMAKKWNVRVDVEDGPRTPAAAVNLYRFCMNEFLGLDFGVVALLRGKNLACFCKLADPCHCDVLLELANK